MAAIFAPFCLTHLRPMFGSYRNEVIDFIYKLTDLFVYE